MLDTCVDLVEHHDRAVGSDVERRWSDEPELAGADQAGLSDLVAPHRRDNSLVRRTIAAEGMRTEGDLGCITQRHTPLRRYGPTWRNGDRRTASAVAEGRVVGEASRPRRDLTRQVDEVAAVAGVLAAPQRQLLERPALTPAHED